MADVIKWGLTPRQKIVFDFLVSYMDDKGVCPTQVEIASYVGHKSSGWVQRTLSELEAKNWIKRRPRCTRAIHIL